ncbi:hypothetical protein BKA63DRAFT_25317 [Paraphoma chrysanthemicola]|nr:hypothetical protein BKA63DRAFT_25317 [Paraphoma chrysanthemicola]
MVYEAKLFNCSSSCGVKSNPATKKPRRVEDFYEEDPMTAEVMTQAASHCDTCTCCRPKKTPKVETTRSEPVGALKNVCWALAEKNKDPMRVPEIPTDLIDGQQAHAAYRKGKPTPHMRQAAAYCAQEGQNYNASLKAMGQMEADSLVSSQSGASYLDLHGAPVADATRIAKQRTQLWWSTLGEPRTRESGNARGVGEGYRIITGLGRHSGGGRGKMRPAVLKTLINEGWKVEVGMGELLVTGLSKRK